MILTGVRAYRGQTYFMGAALFTIPKPADPDILDVFEACQLLGICRELLHLAISKYGNCWGEPYVQEPIPTVNVYSVTFYSRKALRHWVDSEFERVNISCTPLDPEARLKNFPLFLVDLPDAAKMLGISERTLKRKTQTHEIPSITIGARRKYCPDRLKQWVNQEHHRQG